MDDIPLPNGYLKRGRRSIPARIIAGMALIICLSIVVIAELFTGGQ